MANLVDNSLIFESGDRQLATSILQDLYAHGMNYFRPCPEYLYDYFIEGSEPKWLKWCYSHWGTKWDIYKEHRVLYEDALDFLTANSPIIEFVDWLHETFPTVKWRLEYQIEGEGTEYYPY